LYDSTSDLKSSPNKVSLVGLIKYFSASFFPPTSVTVASSGLNPAKWSFSFCNKDSGIKRGK
jgi:hypothetical protein